MYLQSKFCTKLTNKKSNKQQILSAKRVTSSSLKNTRNTHDIQSYQQQQLHPQRPYKHQSKSYTISQLLIQREHLKIQAKRLQLAASELQKQKKQANNIQNYYQVPSLQKQIQDKNDIIQSQLVRINELKQQFLRLEQSNEEYKKNIIKQNQEFRKKQVQTWFQKINRQAKCQQTQEAQIPPLLIPSTQSRFLQNKTIRQLLNKPTQQHHIPCSSTQLKQSRQSQQEKIQKIHSKIQSKVQNKSIQNMAFKRNTRVFRRQVQQAGMIMSINLKSNGVAYDQISNLLNQTEGQSISIEQMIIILKNEPFSLVQQQLLVLTSRYLIQDPNKELIIYNKNNVNCKTIVRSILLQLIPKYNLISEQDKKSLQQGAKVFLQKYYHSIIDTLKMKGPRRSLIKYTDFMEIGNQDFVHNKEFIGIMIQVMLKQSRSLQSLRLESLKQWAQIIDK